MKKLFPIILFTLMAGIISCDDDDDKKVAVNDAVKSFIEQRYEGATIREAEYDRDGLLDVEFLHDGLIKDAYFNSANKWLYTEWDVSLASLPKAVTDAVAQAYPDFRIEEADFIETENNSYYEVEIDKGGVERWIFVTADGVIVENGSEGNTPSVNDSIKTFIDTKYPGATIVDTENDKNGLFEVEIKHENIIKDVYFDKASEWVYTKWDVAVASLPAAVAGAVANAYPDYTIDDADYIESSTGNCYKLELERGNFEALIYVTSEGEIITL